MYECLNVRDFKTIQIIAMTIEEIIAMVIVQIVEMIIVLIIAIKIVQNISMVIIQIMAKEKGIFLSCLGREARGAGASLWLRPRTVEGGLWVKEKTLAKTASGFKQLQKHWYQQLSSHLSQSLSSQEQVQP